MRAGITRADFGQRRKTMRWPESLGPPISKWREGAGIPVRERGLLGHGLPLWLGRKGCLEPFFCFLSFFLFPISDLFLKVLFETDFAQI
jgi:hypothetical protein